eukprot:scaffold24440_cov113-Isochrysis_galbana.AAC.6
MSARGGLDAEPHGLGRAARAPRDACAPSVRSKSSQAVPRSSASSSSSATPPRPAPRPRPAGRASTAVDSAAEASSSGTHSQAAESPTHINPLEALQTRTARPRSASQPSTIPTTADASRGERARPPRSAQPTPPPLMPPQSWSIECPSGSGPEHVSADATHTRNRDPVASLGAMPRSRPAT